VLEPWRTGMPDRPALPVPPERMAPWRDGRPLKRWRWIGGFAEDLIFCAATARIGPIPVSWWAVWDRQTRTLLERTVKSRRLVELSHGARLQDGPVAFALNAIPGAAVETISPHGSSYIWTKKAPLRITGTITMLERQFVIDCAGLIDDSAGYHARHTNWTWSAGAGQTTDGRPVVWNLVTGLHDADIGSERTVWVDGEPHEVGPVQGLDFAQETARVHQEDRWIVATDYEQPFGAFTGTLETAGEITGLGVTERHAARW
jgi:hypothetical protein